MKHNREFEIAWMGLKPGVHVFQYELDDKFMQEREADREDVRSWNAKVNVRFDRQNSFFMLKFDVGGNVRVACDRCGDEFELDLWDEFNLLIKLTGEEQEESDDEDADVVFLPRSETVIDISGWLYEFAMLAVPLQRIHPDKPDGTPGCNEQALKLLNSLTDTEEPPKNDIWKGLEALKETDKTKKRKSK